MRALAILVLLSSPAAAWEAETTHAGLTEQAALASKVHDVLVKGHGRELGWFEPLTVVKADAATLYKKIGRLSPAGGFVPGTSAGRPETRRAPEGAHSISRCIRSFLVEPIGVEPTTS